MRRYEEAGYPVRAVVMPIVPVPQWQAIYRSFIESLLNQIHISRITLGSICSYPQAVRLMERKLGGHNPISINIDGSSRRCFDGRARFPQPLREQVYRSLLETIRHLRPQLEVGLCLEAPTMFDTLQIQQSAGRCNCVL